MLKKVITLTLFIFSIQFIFAQTLISPNIDLNNSVEQTHILITHDGSSYIGRVSSIDQNSVYFIIRNLDTSIKINMQDVDFLGLAEERKEDFINTNKESQEANKKKVIILPSNQLLYSATALPYPCKGTVRSTMIIVNQADFQLGKHFSLGANVVIPALVGARAQAKISLNETIHTGLTTQFFLPLISTDFRNHTYAMLTIGDYDKFLNVGYGFWFDISSSANEFSPEEEDPFPMLSLAASYNIHKNWRIHIETMALFEEHNKQVLPSITVSKALKRGMFEFGLVSIPSSFVPLIPLFSYNIVF